VSELRLAGATTMAGANSVLWKFLPGFNQHFGVPPAQMERAYRPLATGLDLAATLCFKHDCKVARDNTVRYQLRTLQLLPDAERPSYSGVRAEIQERLDGNIVVYHQGRVIPTHEAPPRPSVFRAGNNNWSGLTVLPKWLTENGNMDARSRVRRTEILSDPLPRGPTPRKVAYWKAVQTARRRGLAIQAIARELGMSRGTVRKYLAAPGPTVYSIGRSAYTAPPPDLLTESLNS
jgi:hypothetical protein